MLDYSAAWSAREVRRRTAAELDALHRDSSDRLQQRAQDVWRWRAELERAAEVRSTPGCAFGPECTLL